MTPCSPPAELFQAVQDDDLTDDALTGDFRVYQRRRGHRYSLDDTLTAYHAALAAPSAQRCLDLGCGLGSVLLMLAYKLPDARLWGLEAQTQSLALAEANVARNGVGSRVVLRGGDLRHDTPLSAMVPQGGFELVTGTPPYQPAGEGSVSPDSQRAHARVELRGGVEDYLAAAARVLAPAGQLVVCCDARRPERVARGAERAGLRIVRGRMVVPAEGRKGPLFGVFQLEPGRGAVPALCEPFVARDAQGRRTEEHLALRRFFDLPTSAAEPASPRQRERSQGPHVEGIDGGLDG